MSNNTQNNEAIVYATTKDFIASTQKAMRSSVRRMLKKDASIVEFSFADSYKDDAKRVFVKIELNDVKRSDYDNNLEFATARIAKISAKTSEDKRFVKVDNYKALYSKITKFYSLVQR